MKTFRIVSVVIAVALLATGPVHASRAGRVSVKGGWVNEPPFYCDPNSVTFGPGSPPSSISAVCVLTSPVDGGWTGFNLDTVDATVYTNGDMGGTADSWFYGTYTKDNSVGGIHFAGSFSIDGATSSFSEESRILGGTCAFAGSSGSISFVGHTLYGGYLADWHRAAGPAPSQPCDPIATVPPSFKTEFARVKLFGIPGRDLRSAVKAAAAARDASVARRPTVRFGSPASLSTAHGASSADAKRRGASRPRSTTTTTVRGAYVNDTACTYGTVAPTADPSTFAIECAGPGATWTGGFTGQTLVRLVGTFDAEGNLGGTYDDYFYGRYMGDGTVGELHFHGTFTSTAEEFLAQATIVGGTCGFAGSSGSFTAFGQAFTGGYVAQWTRPSATTPNPTCNPVDPDSLPGPGAG
jgi:hypothetical protein